MTPRELELAHTGYRKKMLEQWEMVRWQSYYSMVIHTKQGALEPIESKVFIPSDPEKKTLYPQKSKKLDKSMIMKVRKVDG